MLIHQHKAWCHWACDLAGNGLPMFQLSCSADVIVRCSAEDITLLVIARWATDGFYSSAMLDCSSRLDVGVVVCGTGWHHRNELWPLQSVTVLPFRGCVVTQLLVKRHSLGLLRLCRSWNHSAQISVQVTGFLSKYLAGLHGDSFCIQCWYLGLMSWQFNCVHTLFRAAATNLCCLVFE